MSARSETRALRWTRACALTVLVLLGSLPAAGADPAAQCQAAKLRAVAKEMSGLFACQASAARAGVGADPACLSKEAGRLAGAFTRAETPGGCLTTGDAGSVAGLVTAKVAEVAALLRPVPSPSACAGSKLMAAGRRGLSLTIVHAKQRTRANDVKLVGVSADFLPRLDSDFRRAEGQGGCLTTGDARARAKQIGGLVGDVTERLWPATVIGLSFTHPPDWHVDPGLLALSGATSLELNNFSVLSGRQVSSLPGGATIVVARAALPGEPLQQLIARRLSDARDVSVTSTSVGGTPGTFTKQTDDFDGSSPGSISERTLLVYVPRGSVLFQFSLSYLANDPAASSFVATFNALLASVVFAP